MIFFILSGMGTGSSPCPPQGWQRQTRFRASQLPLAGPCSCRASMAYSEQLGQYRQVGGKTVLQVRW